MNAEEARQLSAKASDSTQVEVVLGAVTKAAQEGKTKTFFYKPLTESTKKELSSLGYKVEADYDRDGYLATISWGDSSYHGNR